jgi:hypothetical protein
MSLTIDDLYQSSCDRMRTSHATPARSDHIGLGAFCTNLCAPGLAPVQLLLLGAMLACGTRTETAAIRVMGLSGERHLTNYHRVLNRVTWSARQVGRILFGLLASYCVSPGAPLPSRAAAGVGRSRLTAMAIRFVLVCDPEGKLWMGAFFCTDLQVTPVQILE